MSFCLALAWPLPLNAEGTALLNGRVFERGSIVSLAQAEIATSQGQEVKADAAGRFSLTLQPGDIDLMISAPSHASLRLHVHLKAGERRTIEARLTREDTDHFKTIVRAPGGHGDGFTLAGEAMQQIPGTLGDPLRSLSFMPGVATPLPLFPIFVIRGASPGMTGFFLDGMRVPQLFHLLIGNSIVHGRLVEQLDFYAGGYDASIGRVAGGVIEAETRPARADGYHGELELRIYDVSALAELALPRGVRISVGGHYGYPGPIINLMESGTDLAYWDYVLRLDWNWLTIEALGSFDRLKVGSASGAPDDLSGFTLRETFHRIQARARSQVGQVRFEAAIVGGIDEWSGFSDTGVRKLSLLGRFALRAPFKIGRIEAGADIELSRFSAENFESGSEDHLAPDEYGDLSGDRNGVVAGAFLQGTLNLWSRLTAHAGVRVDVYHAAGVTLLGIDPRVSLELRALDQLRVRAAFGLYQQPPSFPVAMPGIDTFALSLGLQSAWQGSVTLEADLPWSFTFSATGYYQRLLNVTDALPDLTTYTTCRGPAPESLSGLPATMLRENNGQAYGLEMLLRRNQGRVTGWIAYTLSRSEREYVCGLRPADFDQTHVLNIVVQAHLPWKIMLGVRGYLATGRPVTVLSPVSPENTPRNNQRLPDYYQIDVRLDREWMFDKWALSLFLEVLNLTYSRAVYGITYGDPTMQGQSKLSNPQQFGFNWVLPSIGLRGRF